MCLQCLTNAIQIGNEPLFGEYWLFKSQINHNDWKKDWYGLVICNDPSFVFNVNCLENNNDEENWTEYDDIFWKNVKELDKIFIMSPDCGYSIILQAKDSGFNVDDDKFTCWLQDKIAKHIKKFENNIQVKIMD